MLGDSFEKISGGSAAAKALNARITEFVRSGRKLRGSELKSHRRPRTSRATMMSTGPIAPR